MVAVPAELIDACALVGPAEHIREQLQRWKAAGAQGHVSACYWGAKTLPRCRSLQRKCSNQELAWHSVAAKRLRPMGLAQLSLTIAQPRSERRRAASTYSRAFLNWHCRRGRACIRPE